MKKILISGAGIAGLAMARVCDRFRIPYKIIEKSAKSVVAGAGIALPANAMDSIDYMGLGESIRHNAYRVKSITYVSPNESLNHASLEEYPLSKNHFVALHRSKLHEILTDSISGSIHYSTEIQTIRETDQGVFVNYKGEDPSHEEEFSAIIGADGIHSNIRKVVFTDEPLNDFGLTIWRWTCKFPVKENAFEPIYMFDRDRVFMVYPFSSDEVYCYAHAVNSEPNSFTRENSQESIRTLFAHCSSEVIQEMLHILPESHSIITGRLQSVENPVFSKGRFALIGDACHACTPMLQQGAATAFEDVIVLANLIKSFPIKTALSLYDEFRRPKVTDIVRSSNLPIRNLSRPDVNIEAIYENIRKNGPLNVQGWRKILAEDISLIEQIDSFITLRQRNTRHIYFDFSESGRLPLSVAEETRFSLCEPDETIAQSDVSYSLV